MGGKSNLFFIFVGSPEKYAKNMYGIAGDPPPPQKKKHLQQYQIVLYLICQLHNDYTSDLFCINHFCHIRAHHYSTLIYLQT